MGSITTEYGDISPRTSAYADVDFLERAQPRLTTDRPDIMSALKKAVEEAEKTKIIILNSNWSENDKLQIVDEILCLIDSIYDRTCFVL